MLLDDVRHSFSARHQPGRLVTVRLSFSALRGGHLHLTTVRNVANYTGLKLPEVLTWAGGVRVVYTEEQLPHIDGEASLPDELSRGLHSLNNKLQRHHEKASEFFVALMEHELQTDIECSIERQANLHGGQVPLALLPAHAHEEVPSLEALEAQLRPSFVDKPGEPPRKQAQQAQREG